MTNPLAPFSPYKFSPYQQNIFKAVQDPHGGSLLVNAVAGSGKSTTLEHAMRHMPRNARIIALAFNKSIADALQKRIPDGAVASTLNSVGHRTYKAAYRDAQVDGNKTRALAREVVPFSDRDVTKEVTALVTKAKVHGLVPSAAMATSAALHPLMEDTDENWLRLADKYQIDLPWQYARILSFARQVLTRSVLRTAVIDFDDQLYMSVVYNLRFETYDWILVDEAQDLSDIQIEMIRRMGSPTTRYLCVGDRRQSLYQFRGADSRAMDRLKAAFNCTELPLSVTYRCPRSVVAVARKYEPAIEAAENAPEGIVRDAGHYMSPGADYTAGDLVVCRRTLPVIQLAYGLIGRRLKCRVQGRDLAEGIKSLVAKLKANSVEQLLEKLNAWESRQIDLLVAADAEDSKIEQIQDKAATIRVIVHSSGAETVSQVEAEIDGLFSGDGPCVLLSTVHRAKGLEADRVFVIDYGLVPPRALRSPETREQEANICYVAVTRPKKELVFVWTKGGENTPPGQDEPLETVPVSSEPSTH